MQDENHSNSRNKFIILAVALGLLLLACGVWMRLSRQTAPTQPVAHIPAVKPQPLVATNRIPAATELATRIAAVQQKLRGIEVARRDLFEKMIAARQNAASTNDFLTAEMQRLQNEMDAAIDSHPLVVAHRNTMQRLLDEAHVIDTNSAAVLTTLHAKRAAHQTDFKQATAELSRKVMAERQQAMQEIGKTDMRQMTPDESERMAKIDVQYGKQLKELTDQVEAVTKDPPDEEKNIQANFFGMRKEMAGKSERYGKMYAEMPALRSRLRTEDPVIAAMDRRLMDLSVRRQAALNSTSEVADSDRQIQELERQRVEVTKELRLLRIQAAATPSNDATKVDGKNG